MTKNKSNAEKCRERRERLRQDPERWEREKRLDRERRQRNYQKQRTPEELEHVRKLKREAQKRYENDSLHRFWAPVQVENEKPSQNDIAAVLNRTFHYTGQFVPVKWKCRAKLPSGKLCERMDRVKCPFHGTIIARDENGVPSNPSDLQNNTGEPTIKTESTGEEKTEIPPWLDADLQEQIEAATGHDLGSQRSRAIANKSKSGGSKGKGKGKGKKKYDGLTDIKASKCTSRSRLEAKVFNKGAMKRVASALDTADYKRVRDKFGNNFNYAYSK